MYEPWFIVSTNVTFKKEYRNVNSLSSLQPFRAMLLLLVVFVLGRFLCPLYVCILLRLFFSHPAFLLLFIVWLYCSEQHKNIPLLWNHPRKNELDLYSKLFYQKFTFMSAHWWKYFVKLACLEQSVRFSWTRSALHMPLSSLSKLSAKIKEANTVWFK